ncbi:pyridine nucleotide transhydrogenase, partial [Pseudomonas syringae pv. tagetis]
PMVNLNADIQVARQQGIELLPLTAFPLSVGEVAREGFGLEFDNQVSSVPARYNMLSRYAAASQGNAGYQYDRAATLTAIRAYHQT